MAVLVASLSAIGGFSLWKLIHASSQVHNLASPASLLVLPESRPISDFTLIDHHSQPFTLADLRGKWSLIFFGFTHCPDVCPGTLFELQQFNASMQQSLPAETQRPQILFISVDPERDTPAKLEQYLSYFDPGFIGITGDHAQLLPFTRQLGIAYLIDPHKAGTGQYNVAHTASILLTDPRGRLYGVFPSPHDAEKMSADVLAIIED